MVGTVEPTDYHYVAFFNILLRSCMEKLGLSQLGRNYYDEKVPNLPTYPTLGPNVSVDCGVPHWIGAIFIGFGSSKKSQSGSRWTLNPSS